MPLTSASAADVAPRQPTQSDMIASPLALSFDPTILLASSSASSSSERPSHSDQDGLEGRSPRQFPPISEIAPLDRGMASGIRLSPFPLVFAKLYITSLAIAILLLKNPPLSEASRFDFWARWGTVCCSHSQFETPNRELSLLCHPCLFYSIIACLQSNNRQG